MNELNSLFELNNTNNNINIFKIFIEIVLKYYHNNFNHYNTLNILLYKELMTFEKINFFDDTTETEGIYNELKEDLTEEEAEQIKEQEYSDKENYYIYTTTNRGLKLKERFKNLNNQNINVKDEDGVLIYSLKPESISFKSCKGGNVKIELDEI